MYNSHFSLANLPYGIASSVLHPRSMVTRLEDNVIFIRALAEIHPAPLSLETLEAFSKETVNAFAALPKDDQNKTRNWLQSVLFERKLPGSVVVKVEECEMHLPVSVGDFTDFSASSNHVLNAGEAITGKRSLPPAFEHFPVGYHGRSSTIVVSGTPIRRPKGQFKDLDGKVVFTASRRMDYELEVAAVVGRGNDIGSPIDIKNADEHIFGLVLLNDWSSRDIQGFEMQPLGPINGKSFGTTISPWIITLSALQPFRTAAPSRNLDIEIASYLQDPDPTPTYDFTLEARIRPEGAERETVTCRSKFGDMYWTLRDLVAQQTVNGCSLRTGDLLATGTISGSTKESHGCLLELAAAGGVEVEVVDGRREQRVWLKDGDTVSMSAVAAEGVGFGECVGKILSAY